MAERAYTVQEIDRLREACRSRWLYGTTATSAGVSRNFKPEDLDRGVEEMIRTYIVAGITAQDIYDADRKQWTDSTTDATVPASNTR